MTAGGRRLAVAAVCALQGTIASVAAQTTTTNLFLSLPPPAHAQVEMDLSWSEPRSFVVAGGDVEKFPGALGLGLGVLRVSWSPLLHLAIGVEAPYRYYRYSPDAFSAAATGSGSPGVGFFVDWAPMPEGSRVAVQARAGAFLASSAHGLPLSVSDGLNRYSLAAQATSPASGGLVAGLRIDFLVRFEFAPAPRSTDNYGEAQVTLRAGPKLLRLGKADLHLLAVGGYRAAGDGREEGNLFHDGHADDVVVGALLDAAWTRSSPGLARSLSLSVTRQIGRSNALDGWRATLTLREGI